MPTICKTEYECNMEDGSSEFFDTAVEAYAFTEGNSVQRIDRIDRYYDEREAVWFAEDSEA